MGVSSNVVSGATAVRVVVEVSVVNVANYAKEVHAEQVFVGDNHDKDFDENLKIGI